LSAIVNKDLTTSFITTKIGKIKERALKKNGNMRRHIL
jgi:hypothetical protein